MVKLIVLIAIFFVSASLATAQLSQVEKDFDKNKATFKVEQFSEGEDASSGWDYLFYKKGQDIVKLRSIWSASHSKELRIEDVYFKGDDVLLVKKYTAPWRLLNSLKKGRPGPLTPKGEFHFAEGKLSKWIEGTTPKSSTDAKWLETEKTMLESAKSQREYYKWLKEGTF